MKKMLLVGLMLLNCVGLAMLGCGGMPEDELGQETAAVKRYPSYCGVNPTTMTLSGLCISDNVNIQHRCGGAPVPGCPYGQPVSAYTQDAPHCNNPISDIVCTF